MKAQGADYWAAVQISAEFARSRVEAVPRDVSNADFDCTVVTGAGSEYFPGLCVLVNSLLPRQVPARIVVFDLGLSAGQRLWLEETRVDVRGVPNEVPSGRMLIGDMWRALVKPYLLANVATDRVLWLDADCVVGRALNDVAVALDARAFLLRGEGEGGGQQPEVFSRWPVTVADVGDYRPLSAVVGLDRRRSADSAILHEWKACVERAMEDRALQKALWAWDEGALWWALAHLAVRPDEANTALVANVSGGQRGGLARLLLSMDGGPSVFHFGGKPKYWHGWSQSPRRPRRKR